MALRKPTPARQSQESSTETDLETPFVGSVTIQAIVQKNELWYILWIGGKNVAKSQSLGDITAAAEDVLGGRRDAKGRLK